MLASYRVLARSTPPRRAGARPLSCARTTSARRRCGPSRMRSWNCPRPMQACSFSTRRRTPARSSERDPSGQMPLAVAAVGAGAIGCIAGGAKNAICGGSVLGGCAVGAVSAVVGTLAWAGVAAGLGAAGVSAGVAAAASAVVSAGASNAASQGTEMLTDQRDTRSWQDWAEGTLVDSVLGFGLPRARLSRTSTANGSRAAGPRYSRVRAPLHPARGTAIRTSARRRGDRSRQGARAARRLTSCRQGTRRRSAPRGYRLAITSPAPGS